MGLLRHPMHFLHPWKQSEIYMLTGNVNPTHLYNLIQGLIVVYLTRTINTTIFAAVSSISSHSSPNTRNAFFFPSQRIHSFKFSKVGIELNIGGSKRKLLNVTPWATPNLLKNSFRMSCKSIFAQIKRWSVFIPIKSTSGHKK